MIQRLATYYAKKTGKNVTLTKNNIIIIQKKKKIIIADKIRNPEELEYFKKKIDYLEGIDEVISLKKTTYCPYFILDEKTIKEYYQGNNWIPEWFRPLLKQRPVRSMTINSGFLFSNTTLNPTNKTSEQIFNRDINRHYGTPGKVYITLSRMLDSKNDKTGEGKPINLMLKAIDIDGECDGNHEINPEGYCVKCLKQANIKLKKVLRLLPEHELPRRTLFSGGKGYHLHWGTEIPNEMMVLLINYLNKKEPLVDDFRDKQDNFDKMRIFKLPGSISFESAQIITDIKDMKRLPVNDRIETI